MCVCMAARHDSQPIHTYIHTYIHTCKKALVRIWVGGKERMEKETSASASVKRAAAVGRFLPLQAYPYASSFGCVSASLSLRHLQFTLLLLASTPSSLPVPHECRGPHRAGGLLHDRGEPWSSSARLQSSSRVHRSPRALAVSRSSSGRLWHGPLPT